MIIMIGKIVVGRQAGRRDRRDRQRGETKRDRQRGRETDPV